MKRIAIVCLAMLMAGVFAGCKEEENDAPVTDRKTNDAAKF